MILQVLVNILEVIPRQKAEVLFDKEDLLLLHTIALYASILTSQLLSPREERQVIQHGSLLILWLGRQKTGQLGHREVYSTFLLSIFIPCLRLSQVPHHLSLITIPQRIVLPNT